MKITRLLRLAILLAPTFVHAQTGGRLVAGESAGVPTKSPSGTTDVVCSYAPSQSPIVNRITAGVGGAGAGAAAILQAAGMTAVMHSSGAYILTGTGGYIAGTIGAAVVAPILITTSVVVAGTAVTLELTCAPKNHPETMKKVREITDEFNKSVRSVNGKAIDVRDGAMKSISELNDRAVVTRDAVAKNIWDANEKAIEFRDSAARRIAAGWF